MSSVVNDNTPLIRALAFSATGVVAIIVGWALVDGILTDRRQSERITAVENSYSITLQEINRRLGNIEDDIRDGR